MRSTLLGFFSDSELAELAQAKLLIAGLPSDRITLTAMQGPGQSRMRNAPAARDKLLTSLRSMFKHDRDSGRAERLADRLERGAATVSAYANNGTEAVQIAAVLRECGAKDIIRDTMGAQGTELAVGTHEAAWPTHLWPAT
jgi:hypothetical protein